MMEWLSREWLTLLRLALFIPILAYVVWTDVRKHIIPDMAILIGLIGAAALAGAESVLAQSWSPVWQMLLSFAIAGLPFALVILVTRGGMGAGDMKLMALIGALFAWRVALVTLFFGIVLAGLFAAGLLIFKKAGRKTKIPLAPFLAAGWGLVMAFHAPLARMLWLYYGVVL